MQVKLVGRFLALMKLKTNEMVLTGLFLYPALKDRIHRLNPGIQSDEEVDLVIRQLQLLKPSIEGNKEFLEFIRGEKTYFYQENREKETSILLILNILKILFTKWLKS
jgi:hypothetical protein